VTAQASKLKTVLNSCVIAARGCPTPANGGGYEGHSRDSWPRENRPALLDRAAVVPWDLSDRQCNLQGCI